MTFLISTAPSGPPAVRARWWALVTLAFFVAVGAVPVGAADIEPPDLTCGGDKCAQCGDDWSFDIPTARDKTNDFNVVIQVISTVTNVAAPRCPVLFSVTRTWKATDTNENSSFCNQTVTVVDTEPPKMTCAPDKEAQCGTDWAFDIPTAVDKCDLNNVLIEVVSTVTNVSSPRCPRIFSVTRTWRATDTCGNSSLCNQTVTIVDTEPPNLVCGADKQAECGDGWAFDIPTAVDKCDLTNVLIEVVATVTNVASPRCPRIFSVTRIWRARDTCGNSSFCNQTVTVVDTEPPVLMCAQDRCVAPSTSWMFDAPTALDKCDGTNVLIEVVSTVTNVINMAGPIFSSATRTWRASDTCGNSSFCNQTVSVVDPSLLTPVVRCLVEYKFEEAGGATAVDTGSNGHNGLLVNGPVRTNGVWGNALRFDGVDDFVTVPDHDDLDFNARNFTIALWVQTTRMPAQSLVEKEHTGFTGEFLFALNRDNAVPGAFSVWTGGQWIDSVFRGVTNGQWHHLAVSFDGTTFRLWHNGQLDRTSTVASAYVNTARPFNLGRFATANVGWFFRGLMDEVFKCDRALSADEIVVLAGTPPPAFRTLTVTSVNPDSGVGVSVSPAPTSGVTNGPTTFTGIYSNDTLVTVTAPSMVGSNGFQKWQRGGSDYTNGLVAQIVLNTDVTLTAIYTNPPVSITNDTVAWWRFDETNGSTAADSSGHGFTATLMNGAVFSNGLCRSAVFFDGVNDFVSVPDADLLDFNGKKNFTVALKIRTSRTVAQALVEKQHTSFSGLFLLALNRDNVVPGQLSVWTGGQWIDSTVGGLTDGAWHDVAVTFDGTSFRLYQDGGLKQTLVAGASYANTSLPLNLGRFATANVGWPFSGLMDEVRRYNRALSAAEIAALTNCPPMMAPPLPISDVVSTHMGPRLMLIRAEDGTVSIAGQGEPARVYRVEATSDLEAWTVVGAVEADGAGYFEFIESIAREPARRFYRVQQP